MNNELLFCWDKLWTAYHKLIAAPLLNLLLEDLILEKGQYVQVRSVLNPRERPFKTKLGLGYRVGS